MRGSFVEMDGRVRTRLSAGLLGKVWSADIEDSAAEQWVSEATKALAGNTSTVAFVPMEHLIGRRNHLDLMRARGYMVQIKGPK